MLGFALGPNCGFFLATSFAIQVRIPDVVYINNRCLLSSSAKSCSARAIVPIPPPQEKMHQPQTTSDKVLHFLVKKVMYRGFNRITGFDFGHTGSG